MSEVSTSPEAAPEAASVESTSPSEAMTETTPTQETSGDSTNVSSSDTSPAETPQSTPSAFDPSAWDGNIDNLPSDLQDPVRHLHKNLESGYTKKFQDLSSQRKTFEEERDSWMQERDAWSTQKTDLESERDLLRRLVSGAEDPRVAEFTKKNEELQATMDALQKEYEDYQRLVQEDIDAQAAAFADKFAEENKELFEDEVKREAFAKLLDAEWDPELAVKLVGEDEKLIGEAFQLRESGTPQKVAVEHVLLKRGGSVAERAPRPGAQITAGAESANNPASSKGLHDFGTSSADARLGAARAAVNWAKQIG